MAEDGGVGILFSLDDDISNMSANIDNWTTIAYQWDYSVVSGSGGGNVYYPTDSASNLHSNEIAICDSYY